MNTGKHQTTRKLGLTLVCLIHASLALAGAATGKDRNALGSNAFESKPKTLWVSKTADTADGVCDADCSLREAIAAAVAGDRIGFAAMFDKSAQTISLTGGELLINKDLSIQGPTQPLTISANLKSRVLHISNALVSISKLTIMHGRVLGSESGAGVLNEGELWLSQCKLLSNRSEAGGSGGGIANLGRLQVSDCEFGMNESGRGGAIFSNGELMLKRSVLEQNFATNGGAVFAGESVIFGAVDISDSTIRNNAASDDGAGLYLQASRSRVSGSTLHGNVTRERGAAIFFASSENYRALQLVNSTISRNIAGMKGGAVYTDASGEGGAFAEITSCTIAFNDAPIGAGVFSQASQSSIAQTMLRSSIVYANATDNFRIDGFAKITSQGFNLSNDASNAVLNSASDTLQSDPRLMPLANNGGATWTHALSKDSPAIDQGNSFGSLTDQRGPTFARIVALTGFINPYGGDQADIGAFELQTTDK